MKGIILKLLCVTLITLIILFLLDLVEATFNKDIALFAYFTMGYVDCMIFNWDLLKNK